LLGKRRTGRPAAQSEKRKGRGIDHKKKGRRRKVVSHAGNPARAKEGTIDEKKKTAHPSSPISTEEGGGKHGVKKRRRRPIKLGGRKPAHPKRGGEIRGNRCTGRIPRWEEDIQKREKC